MIIISTGINIAQRIFLGELSFKILISIVTKLKHLQGIKLITINNETEQKITSLIGKRLSPSLTIKTFNDLMDFLDGELAKINNYLQKITIPSAGEASVNWVTTSQDILDYICKIFIDNIEDLNDTKFYFLFDEFENLWSYQQVIINEWVKTSNNIVIKVGAKFEGMHTNMTLQGQPLQFKVGECDDISLDYDLFDDTDFGQYQKLLKKICENLLTMEGYKEKDIQNILENPTSPELSRETIDECIKKIIGKRFQEDNIKEYRNKLEVAAIFRLLRKKGKVEGRKSKKKIYAGFDTYTYLSSGIIRIFLNLAGMAVYRAQGQGINVKDGQNIPVEHQSWASRVVSKGYLERIHKDIEAYGKIDGEKIYQFVADIGDIFLERLLHHSSEPETLSISLEDPHALDNDTYQCIKDLLCHGVRESIFYKREETSSYRPKQATGIRTKDYVLNRVYTPALEISYRARWGRCKFSINELEDLLNPKKRQMTKKILQKRQKAEDSPNYFGTIR